MLGLYCYEAFSLVDMHKLLTEVVSGCQAQALGTQASVVVTCGLRSCGSVVVVHGLSCPMPCGIFPDQGSNLWFLHWQADSLSLRHQGGPFNLIWHWDWMQSPNSVSPATWFLYLFHCDNSFPVLGLLHLMCQEYSSSDVRMTAGSTSFRDKLQI